MRQSEEGYSASSCGVPDGARAFFPNRQQGIGYTYSAEEDKWIGDNKVWCSREIGGGTGRGKYLFLTSQWLTTQNPLAANAIPPSDYKL